MGYVLQLLGVMMMVTFATLHAQVSEETLKLLINQIELQQFQFQERVRSEGNSGIKQLRVKHSGTRNYHTETHTGNNIGRIHDHPNFPHTVGMGEFVAVLNGVEFKTRHNDYLLVMPSNSSKDLHANQKIPYPDVPPEVLKKSNITEANIEMREWFKAWASQDHSKRDYRKYFKPVLCYLEGAWFKSGPGQKIQESFKSNRHFLDASSWQMLHERAQYMAYTGGKSRLENLATLPTAFMGMINETTPQLAQWNYRILCHPLKNDLPLKVFQLAEDLSARFFRNKKLTAEQFIKSRAARFIINPKETSNSIGQYYYGLIDKLMSEIPGKDNYPGSIISKPEDADGIMEVNGKNPLNQAYYHRWFQLKTKDASGLNLAHRSFSDEYLFAARNTQNQIAGRLYTGKKAKGGKKDVRYETWSYAVPLEVIYLTPLLKWNPYDIDFYTDRNVVIEKGKRNGQCTPEKAFNGCAQKYYYRTPASLFSPSVKSGKKKGTADTVKGTVCALNKKNEMKEVVATGTYVHLPPIEGLGSLRLRYPVIPVHGEGASVWKELNALRDMVMNTRLNQDYSNAGPQEVAGSTMALGLSRRGEPHQHNVELTADDMKDLKAQKTVNVTTNQVDGHTHQLTLKSDKKGRVRYIQCDGSKKMCGDRHPRRLQSSTN